jgi:hypothetical protein
MSCIRPLVIAVTAVLIAAPASAAENTDVARVSVIAAGSVVVQRGDDPTQLAARVNTPLLPGDFVATGSGTQAEVQLSGFTMLRLGADVQIRIANNDESTREVQLAAGSLILSVAHPESGPVEIDTPSVTLRASQVGDYRLTVDSDGTTLATARSGNAEILTPEQTYPLTPGYTLEARGTAQKPAITQTSEAARDALDAFDSARDRIVNSALDTDTYVASGIAGYDDLNAYGNWIDVKPYGMVWNPYVPAGWAPYRYGSWVWEDGFGWTWIAIEPWGWVPFHYGYWFSCTPYGWCWLPPGLAMVPIWYPALVGWFGFGDYWGATLGWEYWGWVPLWPYEPFYPWYPGWGGWHSHPYPPPPSRISGNPPHLPHPIHPIMPVHTHAAYGSSVSTTYRNMRYGATGIPSNALRSGNFSGLVPIDSAHLKSVTFVHGALPLTPTSANLQFNRAAPKAAVHWAPVFTSSRFATSTGLPRRTQFASQQQQVHQALRAQSHEIVPAKPQTPPASQVWQQFESSRKSVTVPRSVEPHPYQYPVTAPAVHLPPPAMPHPAPMPRPPSPSSGGHPSRPPASRV